MRTDVVKLLQNDRARVAHFIGNPLEMRDNLV